MLFSGTSRFRLIEELGQGGMGDVYLVYDRARDRCVALKKLRRTDAGGLYRFKREFRSLSDLSHPNIVTLYELVADGDEWFFTMEFVEGEDFLTYVRSGDWRARVARTTTANGSTALPTDVIATRTSHAVAEVVDDELAVDALDSPRSQRQPRRAADVFDEGRLRDAAGQLAGALAELHSLGMVHRDLKPSNVRVDPAGRVVLMDFGIVAELARPPYPGLERHPVGTPSYMAPEQVQGQAPDAAADWYAFGAMLYVALTGRLPHEGSSREILWAKMRRDPAPPRDQVTDLPADLVTLCMRLLARDPANRPARDEILAVLGPRAAAPESAADSPHLPSDVFVGRAREIAILRDAYTEVAAGGSRVMIVEGPAGIGKTRLLERFVTEASSLAASRGHAESIWLWGRCHERESVPYKAFDEVVEALGRHLAAMDGELRGPPAPDDRALLARIFPVLAPCAGQRRKRAATDDGQDIDPFTLRSRAVGALRQLWTGLSAPDAVAGGARPSRHAVASVVCIEDLQWADRDSLDLLAALTEPPGVPGTLWILTMRSDRGEDAHLEGALAALADNVPVQRVSLGRLSDHEVGRLVAAMSRTLGAEAERDRAIWREAEGHPMLLTELVRYLVEAPREARDTAGVLRLEEVLWRRISNLPRQAGAFLRVAAVAGEPAPAAVLADAAGLPAADRDRALVLCRASQLIRQVQRGGEMAVAIIHAKIADAILEHVSAGEMRAIHGRLARALEAASRDARSGHEGSDSVSPAVLALHYRAAGVRRKAVVYLLEAARAASNQLALDRASRLYHTALDVLADAPDAREYAVWRCQAWIGLAEGMRLLERGEQALAILDQAEPVAERHGLVGELSSICFLRGSLLFPTGDLAGCLAAQTKARAYARRAGSPEREARALSGMGDALYMRGRMISAYQQFDRCIELCRRHQFVSIEVANLAMRGETRSYQHQLLAGLRDCDDGAAAAARLGLPRAEICALVCSSQLLVDLGRLDRADEQLQAAVDTTRRMGSRRLEGLARVWQAKILALRGRRDDARRRIDEALALCRETGFTFAGPMALGVLAASTSDPGVRERALSEADGVLARGAVSQNYLFFFRDAVDACLDAGDVARAVCYADALEAYTREEPLPYARLIAACGRARARVARGERGDELRRSLAALHDEARRVGHALVGAGLERAREAMDAA